MPKFLRKVIRITAADSPLVRREVMRRQGVPEDQWPPEIPGVLSHEEYTQRLAVWDSIRVCVGLHAHFYEGAEVLLFPPTWLNAAAEKADQLRGKPRRGEALGCDPAEGGDSSCWAVVDGHGLVFLLSMKTPDTNVVPNRTVALMKEYGIPAERVAFDRGGGGTQHANTLRSWGHPVQTVAFGGSVVPDPRRGMARIQQRVAEREERYAYADMRSQMYGELSQLLDPANGQGFAIPAEYAVLRQELAPIPKVYDRERLRLPPKNRRRQGSNEKTLVELIGHSPDSADALVLACHALLHRTTRTSAGAIR